MNRSAQRNTKEETGKKKKKKRKEKKRKRKETGKKKKKKKNPKKKKSDGPSMESEALSSLELIATDLSLYIYIDNRFRLFQLTNLS
jgi:hypothetical protein